MSAQRGGAADRGGRGGGDRGGRGGYSEQGGRGGGERGGRGGAPDRGGRGGFVPRGGADRNAPLGLPTIDVTTLKQVSSEMLLPHNFGGRRSKMTEDKKERPKANSVEAAEEARNNAKAAHAKVMDAMKNVTKLPAGNTGVPTKVTTNFFPVDISHATSVYQYDVILEPDVPNPRLRKAIIEELIKPVKTATTISGGKIIFAARELHAKGTSEHVITHVPAAGARGWRSKQIVMKLRFARALSNPTNGLSTELFTVYSSVISNALSNAGFVRVGGKYYDFSGAYTPPKDINLEQRDDPHGSLRLSGGLSLVMHPTQRGLLMATDLAFRVSRKDTMLHFVDSIRRLCKDAREAQRQLDDGLVGTIAVSTYLTGSRKNTFKVTRVRHDLTPASVIPGNAEGLTFAAYLKNNYGIAVNANQPMLEFESPKETDPTGAPKKTYYVPELSIFAGQSNAMRANSYLQQALKRCLIMVPHERFDNLLKLAQKVFGSSTVTAQLRAWGISVTPTFVEVRARVLADPTLTHGEKRPLPQQGHSWLLKPGTMVASGAPAPKRWAVLHPDCDSHGNSVDPTPFITALVDQQINKLTPNKWCHPTTVIPYRGGRDTRSLADALDELEEDIEFFLVCLWAQNEEAYELVKQRALQEWHVPNQCVILKNFTPNPMKPQHLLNVSSRVAGQVLVKCGASLWATTTSLPAHTMIVGIDVARSTKGAKGSTVAIVAINAATCEAVFSKQLQDTGDRAKVVCTLVTEALKAFEAKTKAKATSVVAYRPGAHEGDIVEVVRDEVLPLKEALRGAKLSFVLTLKSSAVRCHPAPAGLVVDQDIISPYGFSYYSVPQVVNMGTATAMKFSLLANEVFRTGAELEDVTWALCHMFYGWWGTTREPSVVMYATRAADLHSRLDLGTPLATKHALAAL